MADTLEKLFSVFRSRLGVLAATLAALVATAGAQSINLPWAGHGHNAQHDGISQVAAQPLNQIRWQTPVDLAPQILGHVAAHPLRFTPHHALEHGDSAGEDGAERWVPD